jgi:tetrathionate reductase subunit B
MKVFVFDASICNGCYNCQIACKDEHCSNDWTPYAKPQPETGQFWLKLSETVRGSVPKVRVHYQVALCNHCDEAPCIESCKVEGAIYKREDGLVIIDPEKCTGCGDCYTACPYQVIFMSDDLGIAQKCTGCAHLLDSGEWTETRCTDACPTGALKFMEESDAQELIAEAQILLPENGTKPRVYYLNIPKKFIGGTVYDPVAKEVIIGATVTVTGSGVEKAVTTDGFGDFWFEDLETGSYNVRITADGYPEKIFAGVSTEKDVNLGDIPLG